MPSNDVNTAAVTATPSTSEYKPVALKGRADSRWFRHLKGGASDSFSALVAAQERGWTSEAVGKWFDDRGGTSGGADNKSTATATPSAAPSSSSSTDKPTPSTSSTTPATPSSASNAASSAAAAAAGTVFTSASFNLDALCDKYMAHAEAILVRGNGDLFKKQQQTMGTIARAAAAGTNMNRSGPVVRGRGFQPRGGGGSAAVTPSLSNNASAAALACTRPFTFLDLGAAPGGVSAALTKAQRLYHSSNNTTSRSNKATEQHQTNRMSRGVGVSLAVADGGIGMSEAMLKACNAKTAAVTDDDKKCASSSSSSSTEGPSYTILYGSVADVDGVLSMVKANCSAQDEEKGDCTQGQQPKFDLVNGGAVADFGQRDDHKDEAVTQQQRGEGKDGTPLILLPLPLPPKYPVPWFQLFVPQLLIALQSVRRGGDVMIVFGLSDSCSLLLLCNMMAELQLLPSSPSDITFLPTMHFTKPPIYVYFKGVAGISSDDNDNDRDDDKKVLQRIVDKLQVYSDADEALLKSQREAAVAASSASDEGNNDSSQQKAPLSEIINAFNSRVESLWARYRSMHSYWAGESDEAVAEAERVWAEGVRIGGGNTNSNDKKAPLVEGSSSSPSSLTTRYIPIRPQLERMWQDRADALNLKLNRIEQNAAKRPFRN